MGFGHVGVRRDHLLPGHIFVHGEDIVPKWRGLVAGSMVEFILYLDGGPPKVFQVVFIYLGTNPSTGPSPRFRDHSP